jgi:hypothetical protein
MKAAKKVTTMVSNPTPALVAEAPLVLVEAGALEPVVAATVPVGVEVTVGTLVTDGVTVAGEETEEDSVAVAVPFAVTPEASDIDDIPDPAHSWL